MEETLLEKLARRRDMKYVNTQECFEILESILEDVFINACQKKYVEIFKQCLAIDKLNINTDVRIKYLKN